MKFSENTLPPMPDTEPHVGPFLANPGPDCMTVAWIRRDPAKCTLTWGADGCTAKGQACEPRHAIGGSSDHFYEARLTGLKADTSYLYTLKCPGGSVSSHFRTLPAAGSDRATFIYYGDNKNGHEIHRGVAGLFEPHAPLFVMHSGDMTDHGGYEEYRPYFFMPLRGVIDHIPLLPGRGNHEGNGKAYRQVFALPAGDTWYSLDCANVHVIVLDSTGWRHAWEADDIPRMRDWLEADLARSKATWKVAMYHEPSFDLGWRKDDWGLKDFVPLLRKYGVDVTLSGHAHGYQRLHPMVKRGENDAHPITHIISAGAGASLGTQMLDASPYLAADARRFNYMVFKAEGERLEVRVFSENDEPLDTFELAKTNGRYDAGFIARSLPVEGYPAGR